MSSPSAPSPNQLIRSADAQLQLAVVSVIVVTGSVLLAVILMIPVALVQLPALLLMIVVRMVPIGAFIRGPIPASCYPAVVAPVRCPIPVDPGVAWTRLRSPPFVTQWRWCASDIYADLSHGGNAAGPAKCGCNCQTANQFQFQFHCLSFGFVGSRGRSASSSSLRNPSGG